MKTVGDAINFIKKQHELKRKLQASRNFSFGGLSKSLISECRFVLRRTRKKKHIPLLISDQSKNVKANRWQHWNRDWIRVWWNWRVAKPLKPIKIHLSRAWTQFFRWITRFFHSLHSIFFSCKLNTSQRLSKFLFWLFFKPTTYINIEWRQVLVLCLQVMFVLANILLIRSLFLQDII